MTNYNEARKLLTKNNFNEAINLLNKLAINEPTNPDILSDLGTAHKRTKNFAAALKYYEQVLQIKPFHMPTLKEIGSVANFLGFYDKAKKYMELLLQLEPSDGLKISLSTMLPHIMEGQDEIKRIREEYKHNLDQLSNNSPKIEEPHKKLIHSSFYLAYHGYNNKELQINLARVYEKICPSLLYESPNLRRRQLGDKIRVGFLSKYFVEKHPIYIHFGKIIEGLSQNNDLEIVIISVPELTAGDTLPQATLGNSVLHVEIPDDLVIARKKIEEQEFDILIYTDIGMDPFTYFLAFARLAPIQCVMGGHPDTTGIKNIDYFISSDPIEPEGAENHYSEKLIRLRTLPVHIQKTIIPNSAGDRKKFGLPDNINLYICPMMLQKLHPDFDRILLAILERDQNGMILLFSGIGDWQQKTMERFKKIMPQNVLKRIGFVPHLPKEQFALLLSCTDVVLDSLHFGGGTTNFIAFSIGAPVVTLPGEFHRGRVALACYNKMRIPNLIASNEKEYVDMAVKTATDKIFRTRIKEEIISRNDRLFETTEPISEFVIMLRQIMNERIIA